MSFVRNVELTFEVYCMYAAQGPGYRVYVDDDLITERTFDHVTEKQYVEEHVVLDSPVGQHHLRVENINPELGIIDVRNIRLDGIPTPGLTQFEVV